MATKTSTPILKIQWHEQVQKYIYLLELQFLIHIFVMCFLNMTTLPIGAVEASPQRMRYHQSQISVKNVLARQFLLNHGY